MNRLLFLVRIALRERPPEEAEVHTLCSWDEKDWAQVLDQARMQSLTGLVYCTLSLLPEKPALALSENQFFSLVSRADTIERRGLRMAEQSQMILQRFRDAGLHPVLLKGAATACFYPKPAFREYGDIDLFLPPEEFPALGQLVPEAVSSPDGACHFEQEGVDVDIHKKWLDIPCPADQLPPWPSSEATLLMLSVHILKHAIGAGVGLRQVVDMAAAYRKLDYSPKSLKELYAKLHLERWNRMLCCFLEEYLDTPDRIYPGERVSTGPLMKMIQEGGNFGHYSASRSRALSRRPIIRKADTAFRWMVRLPFSLRYAPRLAFSSFFSLLKGNLQSVR